ncbi:MAG: PaaI family thioesterase [Acidimicrobiaceae bacterium]|nr:PaaI family thioesterase [Acidimicrobiaceae bacterium]
MSERSRAVVPQPPMPSPHEDDGIWMRWANNWPTIAALGLRCTKLSTGSGLFGVDLDPFVPNPNGAVNGGILAAMIDQAMGVLAARSTQEGYSPRTASLHVQYHRPVRAPLVIEASALPGGRRIQFVEVTVTAADGRRCATGHGTMVIVPVRSG